MIMVISVFLTHIFISIGMTIGLVPVIGIPLPLMSYGGSALVTNVLMIATALNFYRHRTSYAWTQLLLLINFGKIYKQKTSQVRLKWKTN